MQHELLYCVGAHAAPGKCCTGHGVGPPPAAHLFCPPLSSRRWTSWTTSILPCPLASNWVQSMRSADGDQRAGQEVKVFMSHPRCLVATLCPSAEGLSLGQQPSYNHPPQSPLSAPSCPSGLQVVGSCPWLLSLSVLHQLS